MKNDKVQHLWDEPSLRFQEFNDSYKSRVLKSVTSFIKDGTHASLKDTASNEFKYLLSAKNIRNGKIIYDNSDRRISISDYDKIYSKYSLCKGDILLSIVGSIGEVAEMQKEDNDIAFQRSVGIIRTSYEINSSYLSFYIQTFGYQLQLLKRKNASAQGGIYLNELSKTRITFPSIEEQKKISAFLSLVDIKISLLAEKIDNLKLFKRGLTTGTLDSLADSKTKRLEEIATIKTGKLDANAMVENGQYRFYTCAKDFYYIEKYAFNGESLLISGNGANVGYIHYYDGKFNAYQRTYVLQDFKVNIQYIKIYLDLMLEKRIARERFEGNTPYIVKSTLADFNIPVPNESIQKNIVSNISNLDNKIILLDIKLETLKQFKKGLIQKMFI